MNIAIIGGGITGLAAAHRLHELLPEAELALFEAGPRLGGVLETVRLDGFLVERSADNFLTKDSTGIDLCRRLGIADELIATDDTRRRAFVVRSGRLIPIPEGFFLMSPRKLWPLLTSRCLGLAAKLRLIAEPLIPRGRVSRVDCDARAPALDESVASFARRRLGHETFERLVQPLVAGIYTADPEKLSMAATMPEFLAQEREHGSLRRAARRTGRFSDQSGALATGARYNLFVAPRSGMTMLVETLAAQLPDGAVHLDTRVVQLEKLSDERWCLRNPPGAHASGSPPGAPHPASNIPHFSFDALILAVPSHAAAQMLDSTDAQLAAELSAIEYAGCAVVSLGFSRSQVAHPLDGFGFVVPQVEGRRIIAASFASQKFPGRAPDNTVLIRVFIGGALQPELLDRSDAELRQVALDELGDLLKISGEPLVTDVARWPRSMPQYHVGHLTRVARIEQLAACHPTLALAGNAYHGVGIPQCIASGHAAAERIAARLS